MANPDHVEALTKCFEHHLGTYTALVAGSTHRECRLTYSERDNWNKGSSLHATWAQWAAYYGLVFDLYVCKYQAHPG